MPFPNSPSNGDTYTDPSTNRVYTYNTTNSIWKLKERTLLQEFQSTSAVTSPGTNSALAGIVGGGSYTGSSTVSTTFQPLQVLGLNWNGSPFDYPAGSIADGISDSSVTCLASGTTPIPTVPLGISESITNYADLSGGSTTLTYFGTRSVCWGFKYTGVGPIVLSGDGRLIVTSMSGTYTSSIFKGTEIDFTGITDIAQHPQLMCSISENKFVSSSGTGGFLRLGAGTNDLPVVYPGDHLIVVIEASPSSVINLTLYGNVSNSLPTIAESPHETFEPIITSWWDGVVPVVQSTSTAFAPYSWNLNSNLDSMQTGDVSDRQAQYPINTHFSSGDTAIKRQGQNLKVVNGLPTADFPSFLTPGLLVYDTVTSKVYFWNSTSWEEPA